MGYRPLMDGDLTYVNSPVLWPFYRNYSPQSLALWPAVSPSCVKPGVIRISP
jgi:hypothetical protein